SRSEFRLTVRQDNAARRLGPVASDLGLLSEAEQRMLDVRLSGETECARIAAATSISPDAAAPILDAAGSSRLPQSMRVAEVAKRNGVSLWDLLTAAGAPALDRETVTTVDLELKYSGYFAREKEQAEKLRRLGEMALGPSVPYRQFQSLSLEARQKLAAVMPGTVAQAAGIPGVNAADLQNLIIELEKLRRAG
ncbi:MAG TPA: hypothetical protein VIV65_10960, partial [Gemmatimonadaceae bacterium]